MRCTGLEPTQLSRNTRRKSDAGELADDRFFGPDPQPERDRHPAVPEPFAACPSSLPTGMWTRACLPTRIIPLARPVDLLIIPDHYVFRMLYSQGISLDALGIPRRDGAPAETEHRKIWQIFADHYYLFRGTPSGVWIDSALNQVFGIHQTLNSADRPGNLRSDCRTTCLARVPPAPAVRALWVGGACAPPMPPPIRWNSMP